MCYQYNVVGANHSSASSRCDSQGGLLWWPRNASEELAVNRWFGLLNNQHAILLGITRGSATGASSVWTASDGTTRVSNTPNSTLAGYAHWGADHFGGGPYSDTNQRCVAAQTWTLAYDSYTCGTGSTSLANGACYQTGASYTSKRLSWRAIPCSASAKYVCRLPRAVLPCTTPSPPVISPCLPPDSANFFCNTTTGTCYTRNTAANFDTAASRCRARGGQLWSPRSYDEAGMVESRFSLLASNGAVWIGLRRVGQRTWYSVDGTMWVPEWPTTGSSYGTWAHWGSDHFIANLDLNSEMNCVAAQTWTLQYAAYTCDPMNYDSRRNGACYQTAASFGNNRRMAWRALGCGAAVPYICAAPTSAYQCPPPPMPLPPPSPPVCESLLLQLCPDAAPCHECCCMLCMRLHLHSQPASQPASKPASTVSGQQHVVKFNGLAMILVDVADCL
jgi:hypothetical protein